MVGGGWPNLCSSWILKTASWTIFLLFTRCGGCSSRRNHRAALLCSAGPSLLSSLREAHVFTLGRAVEVCGPHLDDGAALARCLGIRSLRVSSLLLKSWKQQLKDSELLLIEDFLMDLFSLIALAVFHA